MLLIKFTKSIWAFKKYWNSNTDDKAQILNVFNNRTLNCPFNSNIIELFEKNVQQNPNNLALIIKMKNSLIKI